MAVGNDFLVGQEVLQHIPERCQLVAGLAGNGLTLHGIHDKTANAGVVDIDIQFVFQHLIGSKRHGPVPGNAGVLRRIPHFLEYFLADLVECTLVFPLHLVAMTHYLHG